MSLSDKIQSDIQIIINLYIDAVSNKFKLNKNELLSLWQNNTDLKTISQKSVIKEDNKDNNILLKLSKAELVEMCKTKKLKIGGTKQELVDRLTNEDVSTSTKIVKNSSPPVIKKLVEKIQSIQIKRNSFDNFEHSETSFVFNNKTQKVYGKQNKDGSISDLTPEDIDLCNKYKFSYIIPLNLDNKSSSKDIDIKDLEDDVDDFEVEEEIEEEEIEEDEDEEEEEEYYEED